MGTTTGQAKWPPNNVVAPKMPFGKFISLFSSTNQHTGRDQPPSDLPLQSSKSHMQDKASGLQKEQHSPSYPAPSLCIVAEGDSSPPFPYCPRALKAARNLRKQIHNVFSTAQITVIKFGSSFSRAHVPLLAAPCLSAGAAGAP